MEGQRIVRLTDTFEADLDRQLPPERSSTGVPARLDFLLYELPDIVDVFATDFDSLPQIAGAPPNVRRLVGRGQLVELYFVAGRLTDDDIVELQMIELERRPFTS